MDYSKGFLENTIKVWQPYSPDPLTLEDAREIEENFVGLFALVLELEQKNGEISLDTHTENN